VSWRQSDIEQKTTGVSFEASHASARGYECARSAVAGKLRSNKMANTPDTRTQNQPQNQPNKDAQNKGSQQTQQGTNKESAEEMRRRQNQQGQNQPGHSGQESHSGGNS
jgi:hypothetical protein